MQQSRFTDCELYTLATAWERDGRTPEARELRDAIRAEHVRVIENVTANYAGDFGTTRTQGRAKAWATMRARSEASDAAAE